MQTKIQVSLIWVPVVDIRAFCHGIWTYCFPNPTQRLLDYLGTSFSQPVLLLQASARSGFLVAGPRVLGHFLPASCPPSASWDFYCHASLYSVGLTLDALEKCGVEWHDVFEPWRQVLRSSALMSRHYISAHFAAEYVRRYGPDGVIPCPYADITGVFQLLDTALRDGHRSVTIAGNRVILLTRDEPLETGAIPILTNVLTGKTTHQGTSDLVRIIFSTGRTPMQHLFGLSTSCIQCCITGFGAFHCYWKLTRKRRGIAWRVQANPPEVPASDSHQRHGWTIEHTREPNGPYQLPVIRQVQTWPGSRFIPLDVPHHFQQSLVDIHRHAVASVAWEESEGQTRFLASVAPRALDGLEGRPEGGNDEVMLQARFKAIERTVAFCGNGGVRYDFPEDILL